MGEIHYLQLDARYEKVRVGGTVISCSLLIATGIGPDGRRGIQGVSVSLSEAEVHWRDFHAGSAEFLGVALVDRQVELLPVDLIGQKVERVFRVQQFAQVRAKQLALRSRFFSVSFFASFGDVLNQNLGNFSAIKPTMHPLFQELLRFIRDDSLTNCGVSGGCNRVANDRRPTGHPPGR